MELKLARWQDERRSSKGYWLIADIPGLYISKEPGLGWKLCCFKGKGEDALYNKAQEENPEIRVPGPYIYQPPKNPERAKENSIPKTWGANFKPDTRLYLSLPINLNGEEARYPTRKAVLLALEAHLKGKQNSILGELLCN